MTTLALAIYLFASSSPPAPAEPQAVGEAREASRAYLLLSPGVVHILLDPGPSNQVGYQWGARAGYRWSWPSRFAFALGGRFEHALSGGSIPFGVTLEGGPLEYVYTCHDMRFQVEMMPGATFDRGRLFVHATLAAGYFLLATSSTFRGTTSLDGAHAPAVSPGAGLNYRVWRGLALGVHGGADLGWLRGYPVHAFDIELLAGWYF